MHPDRRARGPYAGPVNDPFRMIALAVLLAAYTDVEHGGRWGEEARAWLGGRSDSLCFWVSVAGVGWETVSSRLQEAICHGGG